MDGLRFLPLTRPLSFPRKPALSALFAGLSVAVSGCSSPPNVASAEAASAEAGSGVAAELAGDVVTFERPALGGLVTLSLREPALAAQELPLAALVELCFAELDRIEGWQNLWSDESVLSRWNARAPAPSRRVPDEVAPLVLRAFAFARATGGAFDPTVGLPLRELGLYGDAPLRVPGEESARVWREHCGHALVALESTRDGLFLSGPQVELDLSALAKGYAAERVLALLAQHGIHDARIAVGSSSIAALGPGPDGRGWPVEISSGDGALTWWLCDEALSVSGRTSLTIDPDGRRWSHLFDPRTCAPVAHRTERVLVLGASAGECDMASTALMVMGVDEARTWIAAHSEWAAEHAAVFWSAPADDDRSREPSPEIVFLGNRPVGRR